MAEEEKHEKEIQKQIEKATIVSDQPSQAELPRELKVKEGVKIGFSLGSSAKTTTKEKLKGPKAVFDEVEDAEKEERNPVGSLKRKKSGDWKTTFDELIQKEEKKEEKVNRKDYWLYEGIVVKVMSKALADKGYYTSKKVLY